MEPPPLALPRVTVLRGICCRLRGPAPERPSLRGAVQLEDRHPWTWNQAQSSTQRAGLGDRIHGSAGWIGDEDDTRGRPALHLEIHEGEPLCLGRRGEYPRLRIGGPSRIARLRCEILRLLSELLGPRFAWKQRQDRGRKHGQGSVAGLGSRRGARGGPVARGGLLGFGAGRRSRALRARNIRDGLSLPRLGRRRLGARAGDAVDAAQLEADRDRNAEHNDPRQARSR